MEDGGREHCGRPGLLDHVGEVVQYARAPGGDDRNRHRIGDGFGERDVVAGQSAVAVHACRQQRTRAKLLAAGGPLNAIEAGALVTAADHDLES